MLLRGKTGFEAKTVHSELYHFSKVDGDEEDISEVLREILHYAKEVKATHILYACTHYPLVDELFKKVRDELQWKGEFIDPSIYVARAVALWGLTGGKEISFETSLLTEGFKREARRYE